MDLFPDRNCILNGAPKYAQTCSLFVETCDIYPHVLDTMVCGQALVQEAYALDEFFQQLRFSVFVVGLEE